MILLLVVFLVTTIYIFLKLNNQHWKKRNVEGPEPSLLVGNIGAQFLGKETMGGIFGKIYANYPHLPFVGIFRTTTPCLLIRDHKFLKSIYTTNFKNFDKNDFEVDKKRDPLFSKNPFVLQGEEWKNRRHILTPCFTSGKMKTVFPLVDHVGKEMVDYLNKNITQPFECKELCTKYTIDNVSSVAFGAEGRCFVESNSHFRDLAHRFMSPGSLQSIKIALMAILPTLSKFLTVKMIRADVEDELRDIVKQTMDYREKNNIVRQDFLYFMNQLRLQTKNEFSFEDMTAQAAAFFIDGYETSSIAMSFLLFDLANNPDKQSKLREEIVSVMEKERGSVTYDMLSEMHYLEACIIESLRLHPPVESLAKVCTEPFTYTPSEKSGYTEKITVEPGTRVIIPFVGITSDPKHFYRPEKFIPERFLAESDVPQGESGYIFRPFSEGPRACLGQRFAQMQMKAGFCHLIKNFKLSVNEKTSLPIKLNPWVFSASPIGGLWINLEKIND